MLMVSLLAAALNAEFKAASVPSFDLAIASIGKAFDVEECAAQYNHFRC
jgi:hypothetical protein